MFELDLMYKLKEVYMDKGSWMNNIDDESLSQHREK